MHEKKHNQTEWGQWANVAIAACLGLLVGALGFCVIVLFVMEDTGIFPGTGLAILIYVITTALGLWWSGPIYRMLEHERTDSY